jgi:amino acid permease
MYKNIILPASLLAGTIIGAGIFALPFVFEKAGIVTCLFYLGLFGASFVLIHLMYADLILKTEGGENLHRFPGYAKIYLGSWGFWSAILTTIIGMLFVLTVYLILSVSFINLIYPVRDFIPNGVKPIGLNISDASKLLIFWFLGSAAIFLGIRRIALSEFLITGGIMVIILIIFGYGLSHFGKIISVPAFNLQNIFLPYGAVLFALAGRVAIPAIINYFQKIDQPLVMVKKPIILGSLMPALVYLLFVFGILGLSETVSEDAVSGLVGHISPGILTLIGILGFISLWSSYIVIGLDIKNALKFDLKFPKILAGLTVIVLPPLFYFWGFQSFLALVSMVGGIFIALEGIFVALMWLRASKLRPEKIIFKKLNPLIVYILMLIFIGGMIYEIIH